MKKIFLSFIFLSASLLAQTSSTPKIFLLENSVKQNLKNDKTTPDIYSYESTSHKSGGLAMLYSLLLPGMGELYADSYSSGKYFTIAEGALWITYFGMSSYSGWQKDRYHAYAASSGGVNITNKNADFYATIGDYTDIKQYNDTQALNGDFNKMYNVDRNYWKWNTNEDRKTYRNMWISSEQTHNDLRFVVGAMILNRIASMINAVRLVSAYNKRQSAEMSWNVSVGLRNQPNLPTSLSLEFEKGL
jgi:hypothetical protein